MQEAWLMQHTLQGRPLVCLPGESMEVASPEEQRALNLGCEWTGGTCYTTDGGPGGEWLCPTGVLEQLLPRTNNRMMFLLGGGLVLLTGLGLIAYHLLTGGGSR